MRVRIGGQTSPSAQVCVKTALRKAGGQRPKAASPWRGKKNEGVEAPSFWGWFFSAAAAGLSAVPCWLGPAWRLPLAAGLCFW